MFDNVSIGDRALFMHMLESLSVDEISAVYKFQILAISYLPTPPLGRDMTQGQFLSGVKQVSIQSFPSPKLVASPKLKNLVCLTVYP